MWGGGGDLHLIIPRVFPLLTNPPLSLTSQISCEMLSDNNFLIFRYVLAVTFVLEFCSAKMDLREVGGGCGDWTELARDRDRWRALVSAVMNVRVP
jgi:hypothetical protein